MKPSLFIGSSVESLPLAYAVQANLKNAAHTEVWDQGIFAPSSSTLHDLLEAAERFDFAIFVFDRDDFLRLKNEEHSATRDNVVFELGLFVGRIGRTRSFILKPQGATDLHIPTDLLGVTPMVFDEKHPNRTAAIGAACHKVREIISNSKAIARFPTAHVQRPPVTLEEEISCSSEVWFAWHSGSVKLSQGDLLVSNRKIKIVLTRPHSKALEEVSRISNLPAAALSSDIESLTLQVKAKGHEIAWFDGFLGSSMIISNPDSEDAWARIECLVPYIAPVHRPSIVIRNNHHKDSFQRIKDTYESIWSASVKQ